MNHRVLSHLLRLLLAWTSLQTLCTAVLQTERVWTYTDAEGNVLLLPDSRAPALYTGNFGDCLGSSQINLTRFDASFYKDNMTVIFHFSGHTNLTKENLMLYIGVFAYGQSRFDITFNPCDANINSLCPARSSVAIEASGFIPLSSSDVADIPPIAYSIPDFEGQAILRIFGNTTKSEIGCYSALVTNGATFSQPKSVGTILGLFTLVAMIASFATAIYGDVIPIMRTHYAHSLSMLVVFAVFQHIFFSGALSMNWPSVLVAWWSNFAWAGGMIYTNAMQNSIDDFVGSQGGSTAFLGAAGANTDVSSVAGGYNLHNIYKRLTASDIYRDMHSRTLEDRLLRRDVANYTIFPLTGQYVRQGLPLPGNYSGFAGTLAVENIAASNAFMTFFLWFLILLVILVGSTITLKLTLDIMCHRRIIKTTRLNFFRSHWRGYLCHILLRTSFISFFAIMFFAMFQFTYSSASRPVAIAAIIFMIFFISMFGIAAYAIWKRVQGKTFPSKEQAGASQTRLNKLLYGNIRQESDKPDARVQPHGANVSIWGFTHIDLVCDKAIHHDDDYIRKFGWLSARYKPKRWWFFMAWLFYEFIRACFYAGASGHPMTQVFGLLIVEFIAFVGIIYAKPFEGQRLNLILVYLLGLSKVLTVALSAAFDVNFSLPRITTTAIGIVIVVIQGLLVITLLIAIIVSAISSYMSVMRNRTDFRPRRWQQYRARYFAHLDGGDVKPPVEMEPTSNIAEEPKKSYFAVSSVKRCAKIEDEDAEFQSEIAYDPRASVESLSAYPGGYPPRESEGSVANGARLSRAVSISSQRSGSSLPAGARLHRGSWITREYAAYQEHQAQAEGRQSWNTLGLVSRRSLPLDGVIPPVPPIPSRGLTTAQSTESLLSMGRRSYPIQSRSRPASSSASFAADDITLADESPGLSRNSSGKDLKLIFTEGGSRPRTPAKPAQVHLNGFSERSPSGKPQHRRRSSNLLRATPGESIDEEGLETPGQDPRNAAHEIDATHMIER